MEEKTQDPLEKKENEELPVNETETLEETELAEEEKGKDDEEAEEIAKLLYKHHFK